MLPCINNEISPQTIKLKFDLWENISKEELLNPSLKKYLNKSKNLISKYLNEWDNLKKYTNPYEFIHTNIPRMNQSIAKIKPISRAFFKLVEIYKTFNILENLPSSINTFHLAEGPGGFIEATTYLRNNNMKDNYYGITLINDDKHVPNWKKMDTLLKKYPNIDIIYGKDGTGNLYNFENLIYCTEKFRNSMDIITADGGFDFSNNFENQENSVFRLIFTQVAYALCLQRENGCFILKMFDLFYKNSMQIIFLLCCFYNKVIISKPGSSRSANSEKYIVCTGFKYKDTTLVFEKLVNILKILENIDFKKYRITKILDINEPDIFLKNIIEFNSILGSKQIENINNTIRLINAKEKNVKINNLKRSNINRSIKWCVKNKIPYNKIEGSKNIFLSK